MSAGLASGINYRMSLFLIFGEDEMAVSRKAKEVIDSLISPAEQALSLDSVDGMAANADAALSALERVKSGIQTVNMFGEARVVWLKDASFFSANRTAESKAVTEAVASFSEFIKKGLPKENHLVITAMKVDKRSVFFKTCSVAGKHFEFAVMDNPFKSKGEAERLLGELIDQAGVKMSYDARELFVSRVALNTRMMSSELEKLITYIGDAGEIVQEDVRALSSESKETVIFDLEDAIGRRDLARALKIFRQLDKQNESMIGVVMRIEDRIRTLMLYREALDSNWLTQGGSNVTWDRAPADVKAILDKFGDKSPVKHHPFRAGLFASQATLYTSGKLRKCHRLIAGARERLVSSGGTPSGTVEVLICKILAK